MAFTIAWDKPAGFVGREALLEAKTQGAPCNRVVSIVVDDPEVDLHGSEPVLLGGQLVGHVRAAAFGHTGWTCGARPGHPPGRPHRGLVEERRLHRVDAVWPVPTRLQIAPPYDPQGLRILEGH
ncbi:MAG: glycine cleavage T C-terminal barrel domain-containing protein [Acidimicrobiales bacterium]